MSKLTAWHGAKNKWGRPETHAVYTVLEMLAAAKNRHMLPLFGVLICAIGAASTADPDISAFCIAGMAGLSLVSFMAYELNKDF